jgi:hypothetical protein
MVQMTEDRGYKIEFTEGTLVREIKGEVGSVCLICADGGHIA